MADDTTERTEKTTDTAEDISSDAQVSDSSKRRRRILRPAASSASSSTGLPATLRERSEIAQAKSGRTTKRSRAGRIIAAPFRAIGRLFRPLGRIKFFRAIGFVLAPPYIRNAWKELMLVTWPTGKQTRQLVFAVIVFSLVFGGIVAIVDFGLDKAFRALILKH